MLVLASSRFTRGLCLCLRRTCKPAFKLSIRLTKFKCAARVRQIPEFLSEHLPCRAFVLGALQRRGSSTFYPLKLRCYSEPSNNGVLLSRSFQCRRAIKRGDEDAAKIFSNISKKISILSVVIGILELLVVLTVVVLQLYIFPRYHERN